MFWRKSSDHVRTLYLAAMSALIVTVPAAEPRMWVDEQGREVSAVFSGMSDDGVSVQLKLENGNVVPFPMARLSEACQAFARQMIESPPAPVEQYNFDQPWPDSVGFNEDPEIEIIREDRESGEFVYESLNFRYVSDVRLTSTLVRGLALLFEATHELCKAIPIGMGEGVRTEGKYLIKLYEERENYIKAGGPPNSAGVFMGGRNLIKVPIESLGVIKTGSRYTLDRNASNRIMAHEIAHQLTPRPYFGGGRFNSWFVEGIAEYVCTTPYRSGRYSLLRGRRSVVDYATGFSREDNRGRNIGTNINMPSLEAFMNLPYDQFTGNNGNFNYAVALLLTYYFIHLDGEGDGAVLKAYKRALLDGQDQEAATKILLNGRSYSELENEFQRSWRRFGVRFNFGE